MNTQNVSMTVKELPVEKVNRLASELAEALNEWMGGEYMAYIQPSCAVKGSPVAYRRIGDPDCARAFHIPSRADLQGMPMVELLDLHDGVAAICDYVVALADQPRYSQREELNNAGRILDGLAEFLADLESQIVEAARQSAPKDTEAEKLKALILLRKAVDGREDIATIAAVFASCAEGTER